MRRRHIGVVAHRANGYGESENSPSAFKSLHGTGVQAVEFDVHLTADDELVVIHDPTLERTTTQRGLVAEHTLAKLRQAHLIGTEHDVVPTFAEVLDLVGADFWLAIEPKPEPATRTRLVRRIGEEVTARGLTNVWFPAFEEDLFSMQEQFPHIACCNMSRHIGTPIEYVRRSKELGCRYVQPSIAMMTQELIDLAHELDLQVIAPLNARGNDLSLMPFLTGLPVDWILTDTPREVLESLSGGSSET